VRCGVRRSSRSGVIPSTAPSSPMLSNGALGGP
jgi:hypothetical protein